MAFEPQSSAAFEFVELVARAYAGLLLSPFADPDSGLNGRLFYTGEFNGEGRALVVAANIAGAASLAATADRAAQKQAIRLGVADFLVNSLDEALRILKNQLRKRETVAVCVAMEPAAMEREMNERGVAPDLFRGEVAVAALHEALLLEQGKIDEADLNGAPGLVVWRADSARHQDLALLDRIALTCLDANEWAARRWLRLAPRYLGRLAQGMRLLRTEHEFVARFSEQLKVRVECGEITFPYEIRAYIRGAEEKICFEPEKP